MDYDTMSFFKETFGLLYLVGLFAIAVVYALWPRNREKFHRAAHSVLEED